MYSRTNNPSRDGLEKQLAAIENAKYALTFPSGMAAMAAVLQSLRAGDHVICLEEVYGGTESLLKQMAKYSGISVSYHDFNDVENLTSYVTSRTGEV